MFLGELAGKTTRRRDIKNVLIAINEIILDI